MASERRRLPMMMARGWLLILSTALLCGCGGGAARITGVVTYEGQPVGDGAISFLPADGKGPTAGGPIVAGRYTVEELTPGPKLVKIEAVKQVPFARSSEEMAKKAAANQLFGDGSGIIDPADVIPPNAEGNNAVVEIKPGKQTHDFHLTKPTGKRDR
jgi:hypothetical protein